VVTGIQILAARALLVMTKDELATKAGFVPRRSWSIGSVQHSRGWSCDGCAAKDTGRSRRHLYQLARRKCCRGSRC